MYLIAIPLGLAFRVLRVKGLGLKGVMGNGVQGLGLGLQST